MTEKKYRGVVVPMVTPVTEKGKVDVPAVEKIVEMFAQSGVAPLLLGTTGEGNSVPKDEAVVLVETAVRVAGRRIMVYAGLTGNCFSEQLTQAEAYHRAGADVIVATLPTYYALTPPQMYNYYKTLADSITGPLMLYNILATTHMSIPLDVVRQLADHPNIVGLKDSERNIERMTECIAFTKDRPDFSFFCGCAALSAQTLALGADGIVPSGGNVIPDMYQQLFLAGVRGDGAEAERLQKATADVCEIYQKGRTLGDSLAALKVMMQTKQLCDPWMLMPLLRLPKDEEKEIARLTSSI